MAKVYFILRNVLIYPILLTIAFWALLFLMNSSVADLLWMDGI